MVEEADKLVFEGGSGIKRLDCSYFLRPVFRVFLKNVFLYCLEATHKDGSIKKQYLLFPHI